MFGASEHAAYRGCNLPSQSDSFNVIIIMMLKMMITVNLCREKALFTLDSLCFPGKCG